MSTAAPRTVLLATIVLLVVATVATLARHTSRVVGSNGIPPAAFVVSVPPGERACEAIPAPPATARAIRMTVGVYSDPRARLLATAGADTGGRPVAVRDGVIELPVANAGQAGRICVANAGRGKVELAGVHGMPGSAAFVGRTPSDGLFGMLYLKDRPNTWAAQAGVLLARVGYAKGPAGFSGTGALLIVLLLATIGGALALSWRVLRP